MLKVIKYLKSRLEERSTWMLLVASLGSVAGLPRPFNWLGFVGLVFAALTPDGTVSKEYDTK
jgi:hypothetical protein